MSNLNDSGEDSSGSQELLTPENLDKISQEFKKLLGGKNKLIGVLIDEIMNILKEYLEKLGPVSQAELAAKMFAGGDGMNDLTEKLKKRITKKLQSLGISQNDVLSSVKQLLSQLKEKKEAMDGTPAGDLFKQIFDSLGFDNFDFNELEAMANGGRPKYVPKKWIQRQKLLEEQANNDNQIEEITEDPAKKKKKKKKKKI